MINKLKEITMGKITIKNVESYLSNIQNRGYLKGLDIVYSDARLGKLIALAERGESGTVNIKSDHLSISEMYAFLQGFDKAKGGML